MINPEQTSTYKLAVLVSGNGTNLQSIIDAIHKGELINTEISIVVADRDCFAIERALDHDIPTFMVERGKEFEQQLLELLTDDINLIVLAGFLSILPTSICEKFHQRIINIHPSLLPKYGGRGMYGKKVHEAVLANREKETGATVHFVTPEIDAGEIILQEKITIKEGETAEWLAAKVHQIEHKILVEAIRLLQQKHYHEN